jgi:hypothetical protein
MCYAASGVLCFVVCVGRQLAQCSKRFVDFAHWRCIVDDMVKASRNARATVVQGTAGSEDAAPGTAPDASAPAPVPASAPAAPGAAVPGPAAAASFDPGLTLPGLLGGWSSAHCTGLHSGALGAVALGVSVSCVSHVGWHQPQRCMCMSLTRAVPLPCGCVVKSLRPVVLPAIPHPHGHVVFSCV